MSKQLEKIKQLIEKREQARLGGGEKAIQKQHDKGKYTDVQGTSLPQLRHGEEAVPGRWCSCRFWYH